MSELPVIVEEVRKIIRENLDVEKSLSKDGPLKHIQHILRIKPTDISQSKIYEILLSNFITAEKTSPGSGNMFLRLFVGQKIEDTSDTPVTKKSVINSFRFMNHRNRKIMENIIDMSGSSTSVILKKSSNHNFYIEAYDGYSFPAKSLVNIRPQLLKNVSVLCIDGYVESVSEIHHVLTFLSDNKIPCALFCRGLSDDVANTIKVNNDRGNLVLFPYQITYDLEGVNTLVDIATASNTDVVSSLKGQLISSIDMSTLKMVESCNFQSNKVILKNAASKKSTKILIKQLKEKMEKNPELTETLIKRIKCLSSSCVEVALPDDASYACNSIEFDEAIRRLNSICSNGIRPEVVANRYFESFNGAIEKMGYLHV